MRNFVLSFILFTLTLIISCSSQKPDFEKQREAVEMAQQGIYYYWNGGDLLKVEKEFFKGITLRGNLDVVDAFFSKAVELDPSFLPYQYSLASTRVLQGKAREALPLYDNIIAQDPEGYDAYLLKATYSHYEDPIDLLQAVSSLSPLDPNKTQDYIQKFERSLEIMEQPIALEASRHFQEIQDKDHAIVVLGYSLANDGTMKETLLHRLEQALALHGLYPHSPIIVTGGVPKAGVTESYRMKEWLEAKGVSPSLIITEDQAKDTVGNALFSTALLAKIPELKAVTLVTSATHVRRGLVALAEAAAGEGLDLHLASLDFASPEDAQIPSANEYLVIFRDLLRTSGVYAYPGLQR